MKLRIGRLLIERTCGKQVGPSHPCALPAGHPLDMHACAQGDCSWGSYQPNPEARQTRRSARGRR